MSVNSSTCIGVRWSCKPHFKRVVKVRTSGARFWLVECGVFYIRFGWGCYNECRKEVVMFQDIEVRADEFFEFQELLDELGFSEEVSEEIEFMVEELGLDGEVFDDEWMSF